ncbi:MAG TPA: hypothetical protein PLL14_09030 [Accumulibacter sp.]|nr:hypothetical protein [Accumulibacter sp.]
MVLALQGAQALDSRLDDRVLPFCLFAHRFNATLVAARCCIQQLVGDVELIKACALFGEDSLLSLEQTIQRADAGIEPG